MSKKGRNESTQASKQPNKASDGRSEVSKQAAAKLIDADLNLSLKFAKTALDLYEAGNREQAKTAKAAARRRGFAEFELLHKARNLGIENLFKLVPPQSLASGDHLASTPETELDKSPSVQPNG
jgi:hypothetical protein